MSDPNPYEAPRHLDPPRPRPGRRRQESPFTWPFSLLGGIVGAFLGPIPYGPWMHGHLILWGLVGAVLAGVLGHFVGRAVFEPPPPDPTEAEAEARRRKVLDEIAVADALLSRAETDGDEDVRAKLVAYKARLERKLGG